MEFDTNGDGNTDEYTVFTYNDLGQYILSERRHLASDELLSSVEQSFDDEGRLVVRSGDSDADGFYETSELRVYDPVGMRITKTTYQAFDKSVETTEESYFGPHGIELHVRTTPSRDLVPTLRSLYSYKDGLLEKVESFSDDTLTSLSENRYNAAGQLLTSLLTREGERSLTSYSHDERGFINGWVRDDGLDGSIEGRATCLFDDEGKMISEEMDTDDDGVVDYLFHQNFDGQGRLVQEIVDEDGDLSDARRVVTYRYECD